mgnify:FL=1
MSGGARNRVPGLVDGKSIYGDTTIEDTLEDSEDLTEVTKGLLSELLIPHNLNQSSSNDAEVTALHDGGGTAISGLTTSGIQFDDISLSANTRRELRLEDSLLLGQNDAIALEMDTGSTPLVTGVVYFFME